MRIVDRWEVRKCCVNGEIKGKRFGFGRIK